MTTPAESRRLDDIAAKIVNREWEQAWKLAHAQSIEDMTAEYRAEQEARRQV